MSKYLTPREVMERLRISRITVYRHLRSGRLKCYKVGRLIRIRPQDLTKFIEGSTSAKISKQEESHGKRSHWQK